MVGRQLIPRMLEKGNAHIYVLTHEQGTRLGQPEFMRDILGMEYQEDMAERLHLVPGDITKEGLGTPATAMLKNRINSVFHAAADTRVDLPLEDLRHHNVQGTKNVIDFAKSCYRLERFGHLSTVYVAGTNRGWIKEDFDKPIGFANNYEQSKYEAEQVVKETADLPWSIYRLSTLLGDSKTGKTSKIITPHHAIQVIHQGLAEQVSGTPDFPIDLIPSDYSLDVLQQLFDDHFERNEIFQIASGKHQSISLQTFIDKCYKLFAYMDNDWINNAYPKPVLSSESTFDSFLQKIDNAATPVVSASIKSIKHFAEHMLSPKDFDYSNVRRRLPYYEANFPDTSEYLHRVILYCFKSNWGKLAY